LGTSPFLTLTPKLLKRLVIPSAPNSPERDDNTLSLESTDEDLNNPETKESLHKNTKNIRYKYKEKFGL